MTVTTHPSLRARIGGLLLAASIGCALGAPHLHAQSTAALDLPDLGDSSARVLSSEREREYSQGLLRQLQAYELLVDDPELVEYLETLCFRLVEASGRAGHDYHFVLLNIPVVNAFASPGGLIATFAGLILAAEHEAELAGVLAHEIAHVSQRHIARAMESTIEDTLPILLGSLALAMAARGQGDGTQAALVGGMALLQQRQINFTRENEYEADRVGIQTLARAGFDPQGMGDFFARLGSIYRVHGEQFPEYLRTHPVTAARIAEARDRATRFPEAGRRSSPEFLLMRERLRVLVATDLAKLVVYYRGQRGKDEMERRALRYGMALAQMRIGKESEARATLQKLAHSDPERLSYQLALAEVERAAKDHAAAETLYRQLLATRPGHRVVSIAYARSQLERNDPQAARSAVEILRPLLARQSRDPALHQLFGRANELAGDEIRAAEAHAQAFFLRGQYEDAMRQLEQTARRPDLDYYQRARIDAQLAQWKPTVLRERKSGGQQERRVGVRSVL